MASVTIVILNLNGRHFLEKFLPVLLRYSPRCEIVVADNNSSDDSITFVRRKFPKIRLIAFDKNYGFCGGYNRAIDQINTELCILLNSDIEVTDNWLTPIIHLFEYDSQIAAIQPKLLDYKFRNKFEYAGGAGGFIDKFGYPFCRGRIFDAIETDTGQYNDTCEIFWASGACLAIRTELFRSYGGFDEDFFAHMEEIDLCWRMKSDGYKVYYCAESVVYHVGGGTLNYSNPRKTYLNFRNSMIVLVKNLPINSLIYKLPIRWLVDYMAILKFILSGSFTDGLMILKAHLYIWINLPKSLKKRRSLQKMNENHTGIYPKFLLFRYHIARVRKFSDLKF